MQTALTRTTSIPRKPWVFRMSLLVVAFGALLMYLAALSSGPDIELRFEREVPSDLSLVQLQPALDNVQNWPNWFFSVSGAILLDKTGAPVADGRIRSGELVKLTIDPKGNRRRRFELELSVIEYVPGQRIRMKVLSDSSGKLTRFFNPLEWSVELARAPSASGSVTLIRGEAVGRTKHWRSRLFGHVSPKTLMYQVYYPDLMGLARFAGDRMPELFPSGG
jgi:hypothetical protein